MTSSMAEVSFLRLPEPVEDFEQEDIFSFDSLFPFCSLDDPHSAALDREISDWISESGSGSSFEEAQDSDNQVTFVMDSLQQRVEQPHVLEIGSFEPVPILEYDFGLIHRNVEEIGGNCYELELLGLGIGSGDHQDGNCGGFVVSDCGDELLVATNFDGGSNSVDFGSDSGEDLLENESRYDAGNGDLSIGFCWDSLPLEDHGDGNDEFEWEEVDVLPIAGPGEDQIEQPGSRNLEWEVLLNVGSMERNPDAENNEGPYFFGGNDDYIYTTEYEMTIGLAGVENPSVGRPPASKLAVESLGCVIVTDEDVVNGNALCAVCKDDMGVGEQAKQLPCSHCYHGECIVPWLEISNTCPVCRHELPTDDPDYEQRRALRGARAQ